MVSISVVMPVYNTPVPLLKEAVDSILNQTFRDFEFIIIDDGSKGQTASYLDRLDDPRIKLLRNETNIGITKSLNIGFRAAQGKYIARMDSDDISLEERFEKQFSYMETHKDVAMCGSAVEEFGSKNGIKYTVIHDLESYKIKSLFYYPGPLHPTVFIRKEILTVHNISYHEDLIYAQDYALYVDISTHGGLIYNMPDVLLKRRNHKERITSQHYEEQKKCSMQTQKRLLSELIQNVNDEQVKRHYRYFYEKKLYGFLDCIRCTVWSAKLIIANHCTGRYAKAKFDVFAIKLLLYVICQTFLPHVAEALVKRR